MSLYCKVMFRWCPCAMTAETSKSRKEEGSYDMTDLLAVFFAKAKLTPMLDEQEMAPAE